MRIERTGKFKRDYRRELRGRHRIAVETTFFEVLNALINEQQLDKNIETMRYPAHGTITGIAI